MSNELKSKIKKNKKKRMIRNKTISPVNRATKKHLVCVCVCGVCLVIPVKMNPVLAFEYLFFAVFGQTTHGELKVEVNQPQWTAVLFKLTFGVYMLVSVVVLINLLIAMMSDTYQRIQAQSDIEWKYGLSKLIRNMHR